MRFGEIFTAAVAALLAYAVLSSGAGNPALPTMVFATGAIYFALWAFGDEPLHGSAVLIPLAGMAALAWLSSATAGMQWSAYLVLAILAVQFFYIDRLRAMFLSFCVVFGAIYAAFGLVHANGTFLNRNHFAAFLELLLPIACWQAVRMRKPIYAAGGALVFLSIVVSTSRAGIVLATAELLFVAALALRRYRRVRRQALVFIVATLALAALAGGAAWTRFGNLAADAQHSTRALTARATIAMIREQPLRGYGLGTWEAVYPHFAETDTGFHMLHADDDWLEWTAEGGLPFLALLCMLAAIAVRNAWREPWSIGVVAVLLHGLTEFPLQKPAVMSWLVVLLANSAMARRQH